ncbi:MAG: hypothetical protein HN509_16160 [Halobacteriovoraceae bacterium]|jgi:hypothetical protein|nr:hypothetical protein [Halobacteriovoraceae bacterium]MBT5094370.1 hypothetical protein [Halobacteriovoraceae bacterium]
MKHLLLIALLAAFISSCGTFGPKPQTVYHRKDLKTKVSKLIVFPVTDFQGRQSAGAKKLDVSVSSAWAELYGKEKVVPGGAVLYKLIQATGKDSYKKLISSLDNISAVEQLHKNPKVRKFISKVTKKFGNYHFALAIENGGPKYYKDGKPVLLHIGLFDSKNMTWKWITKIKDQKGTLSFGGYDGASMGMVSNSFDLIEKLEEGARTPASKK